MPTTNPYSPLPTPYVGPTTSSPPAIVPGVATSTEPPNNTVIIPTKPNINVSSSSIPEPVPTSGTAISTGGVGNANATSSNLVSNANIAISNTVPGANNEYNVNALPSGGNGTIQFNNNGKFGGTPTVTWSANSNSMVITTTNYSTGAGNFAREGSLYFKDANLSGFPSGSINFKAGGRATKPGFMISPWQNPTSSVTRHDGGLGIWRSTQTGIFQRTQTTINGDDNGPSIHGVYVADGALDFFPDYASGNTAGLAYIILPASFTQGVAKRYIGQISVNAYDTLGTPQWSLGWKQSDPLTPTWNSERTPGNRNIIWDSNNHVSINDADLDESLNVRGNIRIQATTGNAVTTTGIKFADDTFQYTTVKAYSDGLEISNSVVGLNFTGQGVTASDSSGNITITIPGAGGGGGNIAVYDETTLVTSAVTGFVFQGNGVTVGPDPLTDGQVYVEINGGIAGVTVQEEGSNVVASANTINFVGAGVTASNVGGVATVTVTATSGDTVYNLGDVSGATTVNIANGTIQTCGITGNTTFDISSVTSGKSVTLLITQRGTPTPSTISFSAGVLWAAGYKTISTAYGAVDMINLVRIGTGYYATLTTGYEA